MNQPLPAQQRDRGASAIVIAISMLVLMGFAALVVDIGAGFNERAQDQSAADAAVMAGSLAFGGDDTLDSDANGNPADDDLADISHWALSVARSNLPTTYDDATWQGLWARCSDPTPLSTLLPAPWDTSTDLRCISMNDSFLRVVLPPQIVPTTFGRVLGATELTTNAFAESTLAPVSQASTLKPFAVRGNAGTGELCLQTASGGNAVPPCDGPERGSFGTIVSPAFGHTPPGRPARCQSLSAIIDDNIALGLDHFVGLYESDTWTLPMTNKPNNNAIRSSDAKVDDCKLIGGEAEAQDGVPIDTVLIDTGNVFNEVTEGLITGDGTDAYVPLLQQGPNSKRTLKTKGNGGASYQLDNQPLWAYLKSSLDPLVTLCAPDYFDSSVSEDDKRLNMNNCLSQAEDKGIEIFEESIGSAPRFVWVPQIWHDNLGNGLSWRPVHSYRMAYLDGVFLKCSGTCDAIFYPGEGSSPITVKNQSSITVSQLTAFLLPEATVPLSVRRAFPSSEIGPFTPTLAR